MKNMNISPYNTRTLMADQPQTCDPQPLNVDMLPEAKGLRNPGQLCWALAGVQALMSVTALTEALVACAAQLDGAEHKTAKLYLQLLIKMVPALQRRFPATFARLSAYTCDDIVAQIVESLEGGDMFQSDDANCAHQFITIFLDKICVGPLAAIRPCFDMTYNIVTKCHACGVERERVEMTTLVHAAPGTSISSQVRQTVELMENIFCDPEAGGCGGRHNATVTTSIAKVSEVIITYTQPGHMQTLQSMRGGRIDAVPERPQELKFKLRSGQGVVTYRLVCSIEYPPGHYYAVCLRPDVEGSQSGQSTVSYYTINDAQVTRSSPEPTRMTNVSIYHLT